METKRFSVEIIQLVSRRAEVYPIDAEDEEQALDKAWDELDKRPELYYEKFIDTDYYVRPYGD